jgi:hypothetical protein
MTPKSCCSLPLSSEAGLPNEKRPKHCDHDSQDQSYSENYVSRVSWQLKIDIIFCKRFRKQAEACRMIIEDQNCRTVLRPERTGIGGETIAKVRFRPDCFESRRPLRSATRSHFGYLREVERGIAVRVQSRLNRGVFMIPRYCGSLGDRHCACAGFSDLTGWRLVAPSFG